MKKLFVILLCVLMFASCDSEPPEEKLLPESSGSEGSKPAVNEDLVPEDHSDLVFVREETNGTKEVWVTSETGEAIKKEVPDNLYYLEDKFGNPLVEHPFSNYIEFCYDNLVNTKPETWEHFCVIEGDFDGSFYRYTKNEDGIYVLDYANYKSEEEFGELIKFSAYGKYGGTGLKDKEGKIVLPPVYGRIYMPFEDIIVARQGIPHAYECQQEFIFDEDFNLLSGEYNSVGFYYTEEGNYIGIGACVGEKAEPGVVCYDKDGNICEAGYWFIDKNGEKTSEKFDYIFINFIRPEGNTEGFAKLMIEGTAEVTGETGKTEIISVEKYILSE